MTDLQVLLIEDSENDALLIRDALRMAGYTIAAQRVDTADDVGAALARQAWDLVTCDYQLPGFSGLAALGVVRAHDPDVPVVVISGEVGEELAVAFIRAGADDFVLKDNLPRLAGAVEHALRDADKRRQRRTVDAALLEESRVSAALAGVGEVCIAGMEAPELLQRLCRTTAEMLGCDCSHTTLWDPEEQAFVMTAGHDAAEHWARVRTFKMPLALVADRVAQLKRDGILVADSAEQVRDPVGAMLAASFGFTAALCVPLWRGEELIGIQTAGYRRPVEGFAPWQRRAAEGIGHLVSLALDNAHLVERLTRADRIKSEFLSAVSHELRTPLNHIVGFNDLLLEEGEQFTVEQVDWLQTVRRSALDLLTLINRILDLQRLEADPFSLTTQQAIDVAEFIEPLATATAQLAQKHDLQVACAVAADLPPLRCDAVQLKVVLQNLIDNALKFTACGTVTISAEARGKGILFSVADTGTGIPQKDLSIIFEAFRQGDSSLSRAHGGVGLGLYTVRRLVDLLGGEVTVDSEVGRGSTFRIWLPCASHASPVPVAHPHDGTAFSAEVLDVLSDLVYTSAPDGRLRSVNRAWRAALGYWTDDITALRIDNIVHPQSRTAFEHARNQALAGIPVEDLRVKLVAKDGHGVEIEGRMRCGFAGGAPVSLDGIFRNVTEREDAQREAEGQRQLLQTVVEALPVGVWFIDATGRVTHGNTAAQRIWGGARYVGIEQYGQYKSWDPSSGKPIAAEGFAAARAIQRGESTVDEELEIECFDRARKIILNSSIPLRDAAGGITGAVVVNHDITDRRQAEAQLRQSEERFALVLHGSNDGILDWNLQTNEAYFSPRWKEMLGLPEDARVDPWQERLHPDDVQRVLATFTAHLDGSLPLYECEQRMLHADGTYHWFLSRALCLRDARGEPIRMAGSYTDITERVEALQTLAQNEERLRALVEYAADGIFVHDMMGIITDVNPAACSALGYRRDELVGRLVSDVDPSLDPDRALQLLNRIWSGIPAVFETEHRRKDGSTFPVETRAVRFTWNGQPHVLGTVRDITERKRVEEALRQSEGHYRTLVEDAHDGIYTHDLVGNYTSVNPAMARETGYTREELLTMNAAQLVVPEDFHLFSDGAPGDYLMRIRRKDGGVFTVDIRSRPVLRDGTVVGWEGVARDVTERQRMELALREAQASLQLATESAKVALWKSDLGTFTIRFSSGWKHVLGRDESEIPLAALWDLVHPDDRDKAITALQEHLQERTSVYETEQRMRHADGSYRWVLSRGMVAYDTAGRPSHLFGADIDITERKALEDALQVSEERFSLAMDAANDGLWDWSVESNEVYYSPRWKSMLGYGGDEIENTYAAWVRLVHPDDVERVKAQRADSLARSHDHLEVEFRMRHKAGHYLDVLSRSNVVQRARDGRPSRIVGTHTDITTLRQAERRLQVFNESLERQVAERTRELTAAHERLRLITDNMFDMVSLVSLDGVYAYVSPAHQRTLGYSPDNQLGKSIGEFLHPDDAERVMVAFANGVKKGTGFVESRYRHADGHYVWLETLGKVLFDDHGVPVRAVLSGRDITERKRAEDEVRRLNLELEQRVRARTAELEAANEELEAFSYSVSHDLRAPLRHVEGFSKMLIEDCADRLDDGGRHSVECITAGCRRMGQIIEDLLALSRVARHELRRESVDLSAAAHKIIAALRAGQPGRVVEVVIADHLHATGDPGLLHIVLENLLGKAWKYTSKRPHARIEFGQLRIEGEGSGNPQSAMALFVRDDGAGIDSAHAGKLFAPFRRLHSAAEFEGTGIGLAIVQRIIRRHGGRVWAEAAVEQGATFYFTLPQDVTFADPAESPLHRQEDPGDLVRQ